MKIGKFRCRTTPVPRRVSLFRSKLAPRAVRLPWLQRMVRARYNEPHNLGRYPKPTLKQ